MEQQIRILAPFTEKDVKSTIFSIANMKSPGPDGYGTGSFKTAWSKVGKGITEVLKKISEWKTA